MRYLYSLVCIMALTTLGTSQDQSSLTLPPAWHFQHTAMAPSAGLLAEAGKAEDSQEHRKDPGYETYKEGYDAILDERWRDAIKKFSELRSRYLKSEYVDDAEYWEAYALSHVDRKKAIAAYEKFMDKHPKSKYVDDVVADLGNLSPLIVVTSARNDSGQVSITVSPDGQRYTIRQDVRTAEEDMRKSEEEMRKLNRQLLRLAPHPRIPRMAVRLPSMALWEAREAKLDPATQVRLDALYAIGASKEDEAAFQTLKDVALDRSQNIRLRQAAIEVLSDFRRFDIMPVFMELARKDTNSTIQETAIEYIGRLDKDKNKSVEALISLFHSMSAKRKEDVLFAIADVGNDKAVDFLTTVARTNDDYDLRSDAVYYLGTIGGEKARSALYQILRNK